MLWRRKNRLISCHFFFQDKSRVNHQETYNLEKQPERGDLVHHKSTVYEVASALYQPELVSYAIIICYPSAARDISIEEVRSGR